MCNIKPSQEDALFIMMEILKDVSLIDKVCCSLALLLLVVNLFKLVCLFVSAADVAD